MRCYLLTVGDYREYAPTQTAARGRRRTLMNEIGCSVREVTITPAEIPTAKSKLIEFVNELLVEKAS